MDQSTIKLAIEGLEAQRSKLDAAIADLRAQARGATNSAAAAKAPATRVKRGRRRMTAAGRAALAAAAKRRWAKAKAAGKSRL
jgi:hypothetical protein